MTAARGRRLTKLEAGREAKGGQQFTVLLWPEGEPEPNAPDGHQGIVVKLRKPRPQPHGGPL